MVLNESHLIDDNFKEDQEIIVLDVSAVISVRHNKSGDFSKEIFKEVE